MRYGEAMNAVAPLDQPSRFRITADMFEAMFDAGMFADAKRVELRDGELVQMNAIHVRHASAVIELGAAFVNALKAAKIKLRVLAEPSVRTDDYNVPQPDVVVWDPVVEDGFAPGYAVRIAVEISDSTLADDLGSKAVHYAGSGIPEYWVVDVRGRTIRQHSGASESGYAVVRSVAFGEPAASLTVEGLIVDTSDL